MRSTADNSADDDKHLREWLERNLEATKTQGKIRGYTMNDDGTAGVLLQPAVPFVKMKKVRRSRAVVS